MRAAPLLLIAAVAGCTELPTGLAAFDGKFSYRAADANGRPVFGGTLRLKVNADSSVEGTHDLVVYRIGGSSQPTVIGHVSGDAIFLWLDPNPDGGILIDAHLTPGGFSGSWSYNTIAGPRPGGGFFAQRSDDLLSPAR